MDQVIKPFALVASDLHLKRRTWSNRPIEGDSYFAWEQIVEQAITHEVKVVILAGDILDKQINGSEPIVKLVEGITRLGKAGIQTLFIQGQHEYQEIPWASISPYATHIHRNHYFEVDDAVIVGIDFQPKERLFDELSWVYETLDARPEETVLVMHQVWQDWMGDKALPQGALQDVINFIPGLSLLITGDLHQSRLEDAESSEGELVQSLRVLSPGSTCMQSIAEPEDKNCYLLTSRTSGETSGTAGRAVADILEVTLSSRRFVDWPFLSSPGDIEDVIREFDEVFDETQSYAEANELPDFMRKPLVRFRYDYSLSGDIRRLENLVGDRGHIFLKEYAPSDDDNSFSSLTPDSRVLMSTLLDEVDCDENVRQLASRLLSGADPTEELGRWQKEKLNESS